MRSTIKKIIRPTFYWVLCLSLTGVGYSNSKPYNENGTVCLRDPDIDQPISKLLTGHKGRYRLAFHHPTRRLLASAGQGWHHPDTGQPISEPLTGHQGVIWALAFDSTGRLLASAGGDGIMRLWLLPLGRSQNNP